MEGVLLISLFAVILLGFLGWYAAKAHSRKMIGEVRITVSEPNPRMGEEVTFRLRIQPPGAPTLNELTLRLHAYEWIRWTETRTSTNSKGQSTTTTVTKTKTETLLTKTWREHVGRQVTPNEPFVLEGTIRIPIDGPPSFERADNNQIRWRVEGEVDIAGWPDLSRATVLNVQPVVAAD